MKRLVRFGVAVGVIVAALVMIASVAGSAQDKDAPAVSGGGRLDGSWNVRVTIRNCQTGDPIRSFDSVTQFMQGGTLIDSTSGIPQALKTPGEGIWEHTVGSGYRFKFRSFTFDAAGNYTGYTIIQHTAAMASSGDDYESAGTVEIYTPNGTLVGNGCSTTTASRMTF